MSETTEIESFAHQSTSYKALCLLHLGCFLILDFRSDAVVAVSSNGCIDMKCVVSNCRYKVGDNQSRMTPVLREMMP